MKKTLVRSIATLCILAVVALTMVMVVDATQYTKTGVKMYSNNATWVRYSHTWLAAGDTVIIPFTVPRGAAVNPSWNFVISTKDTAVLAVRLQYSHDNTNWTSLTIGTDSTTWANTSTTAWKSVFYSMNTGTAAWVNYVGAFPYTRFYIYNGAAVAASNKVGADVRVDIVPQN